jgi:hypothetical protein
MLKRRSCPTVPGGGRPARARGRACPGRRRHCRRPRLRPRPAPEPAAGGRPRRHLCHCARGATDRGRAHSQAGARPPSTVTGHQSLARGGEGGDSGCGYDRAAVASRSQLQPEPRARGEPEPLAAEAAEAAQDAVLRLLPAAVQAPGAPDVNLHRVRSAFGGDAILLCRSPPFFSFGVRYGSPSGLQRRGFQRLAGRFTVNPPRRIRQHNGEVAGGAHKTHK